MNTYFIAVGVLSIKYYVVGTFSFLKELFGGYAHNMIFLFDY